MIIEPGRDHRLGPGDVIEIKIADAPELSSVFRVTANGDFQMPYLGRVPARQKTSEEIAAYIADHLRGRYLKDPQVSVSIKQIHSHSFFIQGAVRRPGVYQVEGRPSLLKLLTAAGGLGENHGSTAFIIREIKIPAAENSSQAAEQRPDAPSSPPPAQNESGKYELLKVNISGLLAGRFERNLLAEPGDIINIPPSDVFFVAGEVNSPGSFPLKEGTTIRQAITLAQGTTYKAAADRAILFREDPATGKRLEIKIDVGATMSGKTEDLAILPNDILIVPHSRAKAVGGTLLSAFGMSAARIPRRLY
jgi:polysaccharide export outer membrane protein